MSFTNEAISGTKPPFSSTRNVGIGLVAVSRCDPTLQCRPHHVDFPVHVSCGIDGLDLRHGMGFCFRGACYFGGHAGGLYAAP